MSEENTNAAAEADKVEPSQGVQGQAQQTTEQTDEEALDREGEEGADDEAGQDDGDAEDGEKKRGKSRSERQARKIERLQAQIAELQTGRASAPVADGNSLDAAVEARIGKPPNEDDFKDYFDYRDAKAAYEADKRVVTRDLKEAAGRHERAQIERVGALADDYEDNLKDAAERIPDLIDTLKKSTFRPTKGVELLILETGDKAPLIAYYLAQNEREASRLNQMPERQALRELGRIEALVSLPKNNATRAPSPINRPKGGATPNRGLGKSMSDYERWRNSGN